MQTPCASRVSPNTYDYELIIGSKVVPAWRLFQQWASLRWQESRHAIELHWKQLDKSPTVLQSEAHPASRIYTLETSNGVDGSAAMDSTLSNVPHELTNTIISLQETVKHVRRKIEKDQQKLVFDPSQPVSYCHHQRISSPNTDLLQIGHLLDSTDASSILSLAKPTSEMKAEMDTLEKTLATLQQTLTLRSQWRPPHNTTSIPCSTDFLDLSDLSTAVSLVSDVVKYFDPPTQLTPQKAFAEKTWTWDPLWREFFSHDPSLSPPTSTYLSRWYFDPKREIWAHANMADSGLMPDEAQQRLGGWEDWTWDSGCGEWGLDVSCELEEDQVAGGAKLWVFASRWQEREGVWVYVGRRGG